MNALKHGLRAETLVLGNEDPEAFERMVEDLTEELRPEGSLEFSQVMAMAVALWRLQRAWVIEASELDDQMDRDDKKNEARYEQMDEGTRTALAFRKLADKSRSLGLLIRYEGSRDRQFQRAFQRLMLMQKRRGQQEKKAPEPLVLEG